MNYSNGRTLDISLYTLAPETPPVPAAQDEAH